MGTNTSKTRIKKNVLLIIATDPLVKARLCERFGKSFSTIAIWIDKNNPMLTTVDALKIIQSELSLPIEDITDQY